ncbi:MAG: methionine--tRNA ligase [Candidatus Aminicenantes bacterium]|nr:methionine--tRNA ligase [Candidatus Aminicenantes bacterium]
MDEKPKQTFYITTPIYYVNDVPHIGHAYTTIIADALSRYNKLAGKKVFFLTGTDEHGQKIEKSAQEKGIKPIELADKVVKRFKSLWEELDISYDYFIRTTEKRHENGVQDLFRKLKEKGDIYKGVYEGYYCVSCENFLSEDVPLEKEGHKICPDCGKEAGKVSEDCYFFRLSAYQDRLLELYEKDDPPFVRPESRLNEIRSFVKKGLKDLSITRSTVKWGISVPDDPDQSIYVWFDALNNYLTGIGYGWDKELYQTFWPPDIHLIGKDILRFHAVYWPAFLMAGDFPLPKTVYGHGWWLKDKTKMSKSRGNVLDPNIILKSFGTDALRYFLLREIPIGMDGNFSHEGFIHRCNSDLANDLGNLVQRTLIMIRKYFNAKIDTLGEEKSDDISLRKRFDVLKSRVMEHYDNYSINRALEEIWSYIGSVNKYLADSEPWSLAKDETQKKRLARILYQAACALRGISTLLYPVMPESAQKIWDLLGEEKKIEDEKLDNLKFEDYEVSREIKNPEPIFPRVDLKDFLKEEEKSDIETSKKEGEMSQISFNEFKKMDLRVAEILSAEKVEGTRKLIKLEVDIGDEKRQMVAGILETYEPEDLVGKKLVVIANLEPATIHGIESQAMLLAAMKDDGTAVIPFFTEDIPAGAKVQ